MKKDFLISVEFTPEEIQETANAYGVSIEQLTSEQIIGTFQNALDTEFEGIKVVQDLTGTQV